MERIITATNEDIARKIAALQVDIKRYEDREETLRVEILNYEQRRKRIDCLPSFCEAHIDFWKRYNRILAEFHNIPANIEKKLYQIATLKANLWK